MSSSNVPMASVLPLWRRFAARDPEVERSASMEATRLPASWPPPSPRGPLEYACVVKELWQSQTDVTLARKVCCIMAGVTGK